MIYIQAIYKLSSSKTSDLFARSLSVQDLQESSLGKIYVRDPLGKISATGSLCNVSVQALHKRCPGKISVQDLQKRSLGKISARRPLGKISKDIYAMSLHKISL